MNILVYNYLRAFMLRLGFPDGSMGKEWTCNAGETGNMGFDPWIRKIPWKRKWQLISVFLPEKPHGQRRLAGYSSLGSKESTKWLSTEAWSLFEELFFKILVFISEEPFIFYCFFSQRWYIYNILGRLMSFSYNLL